MRALKHMRDQFSTEFDLACKTLIRSHEVLVCAFQKKSPERELNSFFPLSSLNVLFLMKIVLIPPKLSALETGLSFEKREKYFSISQSSRSEVNFGAVASLKQSRPLKVNRVFTSGDYCTSIYLDRYPKFHGVRILYVHIVPEECISVHVSAEVDTAFYTLFSDAPFGSPLYVHHAVKSALHIFGIERIDFPIFINFPLP